MKKSLLFLLLTLTAPFICLAHEGHGATEGFTLTHYFVEPQHAVFSWSFLLVSVILLLDTVRSRKYWTK
ncbi:MAG: hypothetical protein ACM3VS_07540 [Candidatus Dadabacteria bacterium]